MTQTTIMPRENESSTGGKPVAGESQCPRPSSQTTISKESVIVKLTLLAGACRMPRINKKQIEKSLEDYIKELSK